MGLLMICSRTQGVSKNCSQNSKGSVAFSPRSHSYQHLDDPVMKLRRIKRSQLILMAKLGPTTTSFGYD